MRRSSPVFVFGFLAVLSFGLFFSSKSSFFDGFVFKKEAKKGFSVPGGASEDNGKLRRKWNLRRFADPATGQIPEGILWAERAFAAQMPLASSTRNENWTARGPHNVGGRTRAFAMDVLNENHLFAGGVSGGLWESSDGGQTWSRRTPLNAHPGCVSVVQDTRAGKTDTWYYLSGEIFGTSASGGGAFYLGDGLFKSTDNGSTWASVSSTAAGNPASFSTTYQSGWRVVTNPTATQDEVYMALYGGIYRSANGGSTWQNVLGNGTNGPYFSDLAVTSTGVFYAVLSDDSAKKGIWRSTNGQNWTLITPDFWPATVDRFVIGINPNDENEVYFLGSTPGSGHYTDFLRSDDWQSLWHYKYVSGDGSGAGGEWQDRSLNLPSAGTQLDRFACQGGYDLVVKVQPTTGHVFIGGTNVFRSTDGFSTPDNSTKIGGYGLGSDLPYFEIYPNHHPDIHDLAFLPSNSNVLFCASDGGVAKTSDCLAPSVAWTSLNNGYRTTQFYTVMLDESAAGDPTIIGGLQDNGNFWTNSAASDAIWKQTVNGDGAFGAILPGGQTALLCRQEGRLVKTQLSPTGDVTAFRRIDPIGPERGDYLFINPFAVDPSEPSRIFWPAGRRLYRQDSLSDIAFSTVWDSISQGWFPFADTTLSDISAIAVAKTSGDRVFLGTAGNQIYRIDGAKTATPTFTKLTSPISGAGYVTCIAIDPANADEVIICYSNYGLYSIWRSLDAGQTWVRSAGNLETNAIGGGSAPSIRWLSILPFADGSKRYFCGTSVGLFSTDSLKNYVSVMNTGTVWALEGASEIGNVPVDMIAVRAIDGTVAAATHGNGMFSATAVSSVSVNETRPVSQLFEVKTWPTLTDGTIHFSWKKGPTSGFLEVEILNQKGQIVRRERVSATAFSAEMNVADLPSGCFFWRVRAEKGGSASGRFFRFD